MIELPINQIVCGDCLEIMRDWPEKCVDLVCTSPPYNQLDELSTREPGGIWGQTSGGLGFVNAFRANGYDDKMDEPCYQTWQNELFAIIAGKMTDDGSLFYNHQIRWREGEMLHPAIWFKPAGWKIRQEIIWDRCGGMMFNARMFCRFDERILWFARKRWKWNQDCVGLGTVWKIPTEQHKDHPVGFPLDIPLRCIAAASDPGDIVVDPFCGVGTTCVAAKMLGRRYIGIDISEQYCQIARERLKAVDTGVSVKEARLGQQALFPIEAGSTGTDARQAKEHA